MSTFGAFEDWVQRGQRAQQAVNDLGAGPPDTTALAAEAEQGYWCREPVGGGKTCDALGLPVDVPMHPELTVLCEQHRKGWGRDVRTEPPVTAPADRLAALAEWHREGNPWATSYNHAVAALIDAVTGGHIEDVEAAALAVADAVGILNAEESE